MANCQKCGAYLHTKIEVVNGLCMYHLQQREEESKRSEKRPLYLKVKVLSNKISFKKFKRAWSREFAKCRWQPTEEELKTLWLDYQDENPMSVADYLSNKAKELYPDEDMYH